jgi:hypothetical protein
LREICANRVAAAHALRRKRANRRGALRENRADTYSLSLDKA